LPNLSICCSGQYHIAVVQTAVDKSLNKGLQNIPCQRSLERKLNLKEMTQAADNYVEAHGHEMNRSETKPNRWN